MWLFCTPFSKMQQQVKPEHDSMCHYDGDKKAISNDNTDNQMYQNAVGIGNAPRQRLSSPLFGQCPSAGCGLRARGDTPLQRQWVNK